MMCRGQLNLLEFMNRVSLRFTLEHVGYQHGHCPGMVQLGKRIACHIGALRVILQEI